MSQLELESLLSYEHHLATCYEAEFLLELSMRKDLIRDWGGYDDSGELKETASFSLNSGAEQMETAAIDTTTHQSTSAACVPTAIDSCLAHSTCPLPPTSHHTFHTPTSVTSSPLTPSLFTANGCHRALSHCGETLTVTRCPVGGEGEGLAPLAEGEPQRKKVCLQRPEM